MDIQYLHVISAIITPVFLILATAQLLNASLARIARITDRARVLIVQIADDTEHGRTKLASIHQNWLQLYAARSALVERAMILYLSAIGSFIASSLAIAFNTLLNRMVSWIPIFFVLLGASGLFVATLLLLRETLLASGLLREEIKLACEPSAGVPGSGASAPAGEPATV